MKLETILPENFLEIIKRSYSLDVVYMLGLIKEKYDVSFLCKESAKLESIYQSLIRKGLVSEDDKLITLLGEELLKVAQSESFKKIMKPIVSSSDFEEFWKNYPPTDTFVYEGKRFEGSRTLRINKQGCKLKFEQIVLEGEHSASQIIEALKFDVEQKVKRSYKTKENKLSYMQNSLTYLNQRSYEAIIAQMKVSEDGEQNVPSSTDI